MRVYSAARRPILSAMKLALFLVLALAACSDAPPPAPSAPPGEPVQLDGGITRADLRFACGGAECAGWLYVPAASEPAPVVVMGHGFAGTRDVGLAPTAERLARAGIAAFVFDYRGFGASGGSPRQLVDPWLQLEDWRAAVAFARARGEVDGERVALFGSSLGAGHAVLVAAEDPALRAVVAQAPMVDSSADGEAGFGGFVWLARVLLTGWADLARSALGGEPILIPAIAPAGSFGMIVDDAAYAAFQKLVAPGSSYHNAVVAHSLFTFDDYDPAPSAAGIRAPILLLAAKGDRFAPYAAVEAFAARARDARVEPIDGDHFDVYSPPVSERAAELATAFLVERLAR
jgi:dienelactone hydrolase